MWEYLIPALTILLTIITSILGYYQFIRKKIEEEALDAINKAEDTDKIGKEKLQDAVETVYSLLPPVAKPFVSKQFIEMVIQQVFDKVEEYAQKQLDKKD